MVLVLHIIIAITSLAFAVYAAVGPSMKMIKTASVSIAATLVSGSVLIFQGADILHLCLSGLVFTVVTVGAVAVALRRMKLASEQI